MFSHFARAEVFSEIAGKPSVIFVCSGIEKEHHIMWWVNTACNREQEYDFPAHNVRELYRCEGLRCCGRDLSRGWPLHRATESGRFLSIKFFLKIAILTRGPSVEMEMDSRPILHPDYFALAAPCPVNSARWEAETSVNGYRTPCSDIPAAL